MSKLIDSTIPKVNPNVNYDLWVMMACQCSFKDCDECTTLVWGVDGETLCVRGAGNVWGCAVLFAEFFCESENVLKI